MAYSFHDGDNFIRNMVTVSCGGWGEFTPPARKMSRLDILPIDMDAVMLDLRIDSDDEEDTVRRMAFGAADFLERRTGFVLVPGAYQVDLPGWWSGPLEIRRGPLRELTSVKYLVDASTEDTAAADGFYVEERDRDFTIRTLTTFTRPALWSEVHRVRLAFNAGFRADDESDAGLQAPPDGLVTTWLMLTGHYYKNRELFMAGKLEEIELGAGSLLGAYRTFW